VSHVLPLLQVAEKAAPASHVQLQLKGREQEFLLSSTCHSKFTASETYIDHHFSAAF